MEGAMKKNYEILREQYPEYISLDQLYKICRIAKRSAQYLLENKIIPSKNTGKKTWRYRISIDAVIRYLRQRDQWGSMIPFGAVSSKPSASKNHRISFSYMVKPGKEEEVRQYFEQLYADAEDVLTVPEIMKLTGLSDKTVLLLLKNGTIKSLASSPRYIVPKQYLLEFVSSRDYIEIRSNSGAFQRILDGFKKWKATGQVENFL